MQTRTNSHAPHRWFSWRIALALAIALASLAYVLPLAATRFIGQNVLRAHARAALTSALEHPVDIQGDVTLTMVPWFGLRTGPVTVANDPQFSPAPLLSADSVTIALRLSALLQKRVVVDSIALAAASLNLGRDKSGRENWRPMPMDRQASPTLPRGWEVESLPNGLRLWNARLTYADRQSGISLDVSRLTLTTSRSRPFDFSVSCTVSALPWGFSGELAAQGIGSFGGKDGDNVFVHGSKVTGWLRLPDSADLPGGRVSLSGQVRVHGESGAFEVADMVLEGLGARVTGQVDAAGLHEEHPYLFLRLTAKGNRDGDWTRRLGLNLASPPVFKAPPPSGESGQAGSEEPSISSPVPPQDIEAELDLASTPSGWLTQRAELRDGPGRLEGSARDIGGEVFFDVKAANLDLGPWLGLKLPAGLSGVQEPKSVNGSFSGTDLRLGPFDFLNVELSAHGDQGSLRLYPFTAMTNLALFTSDFRINPGQGARTFSGNARVQELPDGSAAGPPTTMAEVALDGQSGPENVTGSLRLDIAECNPSWKPAWLPDNSLKAWGILGSGSAKASFKLSRGQGHAWEVPDFTVKTSASLVTGKASGDSGQTSLDIQADRLELDRLRQLAAVFDLSAGYSPWPVEVRIGVKRLFASGLDVDDLFVAGQSSPEALQLSTISGRTLGGRFAGSLGLEDHPDRHSMTASLTAQGIQGAQMRTLLPDGPRLLGPLECRLSLDASTPGSVPVWQALHGQADVQLGLGSIAFSPGSPGGGDSPRPWQVSRASAGIKIAIKPVQAQAGEHPREAATADVTGTVKVDSPGILRSSQVDLKGQAGLDARGLPLWYRQPVASASHVLGLPFTLPGKTVLATWTGKFEADLERGVFSLSGVNLLAGGVPGRAFLGAQEAQGGGLVLTGSLDIPEWSPREAAARLGLTLPGRAAPDAWRRAAFAAEFGGSARELKLNNIRAVLDDSVITGQAGLSGPRTRLDLSVDSLDLDRLAPPPEYPNPARRPEELLPLATLRELDMDAKVRCGRLVKGHLTWENVLTEFTAQDGRFQLRQNAPSFYGGPCQVDIAGDARGTDLKTRMSLKLTGFSAPRILKDLAGAGGLSKGTVDFQADLESRGTTDRDLRRNAVGAARFEVRDGTLILGGKAARPALPVKPSGSKTDRADPEPPSGDGVAFSRLAADFSVREGLAITRDIALTGPSLTAKGDGWINLDAERIDLNLTANIPDVGQVPVRISGELYDPKMDIDRSRILEGTILNVFKGAISLPGNIINQFRKIF
jgi:hypothetical protein